MNEDKRYCYTVGVTLHVWAGSEDEAMSMVDEIGTDSLRIADSELVEQYDPKMEEVIQ